jgi:glycosyltransferase involved in cell wall biosynthesis
MNTVNGVSIIVCCYNSSTKILSTLNHLFKQEVPSDIPWEIILIDNASTDDTYTIAETAFKKHRSLINAELILLSEPKPGKSEALATGMEQAKYSYLVICDDDNWLQADYVVKAYELMEANQQIGILGGLCVPAYGLDQIPFWMPQYVGGYACGNPEQEAGEVNDVVGAGMVIRQEGVKLLNKANFKSLLSSRRGKVITNGEDTEICKVFKIAGYEIYYNPILKLHHFISKEKINWAYCVKLFASFKHSEVLLELYSFAAQNKYPKQLPPLFWIKNMLYYFLLPIKYYFRYQKDLHQEGKTGPILMLGWQLKWKEYFRLNYK